MSAKEKNTALDIHRKQIRELREDVNLITLYLRDYIETTKKNFEEIDEEIEDLEKRLIDLLENIGESDYEKYVRAISEDLDEREDLIIEKLRKEFVRNERVRDKRVTFTTLVALVSLVIAITSIIVVLIR